MFKQIDGGERQTMVAILLNGKEIKVEKGLSVAAAVLINALPYTRTTPVSNSKRAPFCMMGVCYDCLMRIDGKANQRACSTYVKEGMHIEIQEGVTQEWGSPLE